MQTLLGLFLLLGEPAPAPAPECRLVETECRVRPLEQGRPGEVVRECRVVRVCEVAK